MGHDGKPSPSLSSPTTGALNTAQAGPPSQPPHIITRTNQHEGSEHLAINDTWWRRWLVLAGLKTTARLYQRKGHSPRRISRRLLVKTGAWTHLTEAATMQYVAANTSIPVPRVHCAFVHKNQAYIVMERIEGTMLSCTVGDLLRKKSGSSGKTGDTDMFEPIAFLLAQLRAMITELRALPPPPGVGVASSSGGSLHDCRIARPDVRFGPFKAIQDFHLWLRRGCVMDTSVQPDDSEEIRDVKHMIAMQDGPWPPPVFTHADINESNVLVRDGKVVGLIDWEMSGWYPAYWEYTASWNAAIMRPHWRDHILPKIVDPCSEDELKMETTRSRWWGEL